MKVRVQFEGRRTGMGARTDHVIYSMDLEVVKPLVTESSRTGNHWTETYCLEAGKEYYHSVLDVSNSGKHYCKVTIIKVGQDGVEEVTVKDFPVIISPCGCVLCS